MLDQLWTLVTRHIDSLSPVRRTSPQLPRLSKGFEKAYFLLPMIEYAHRLGGPFRIGADVEVGRGTGGGVIKKVRAGVAGVTSTTKMIRSKRPCIDRNTWEGPPAANKGRSERNTRTEDGISRPSLHVCWKRPPQLTTCSVFDATRPVQHGYTTVRGRNLRRTSLPHLCAGQTRVSRLTLD